MAAREAGVRRIAMSLPESSEAPHFDMTSFRVAGKIFATIPPAGDRVHVFLDQEAVQAYCAEYRGVVEELWWGKKLSGCVVMLRGATQGLLREMLTDAWCRKAPKKVLAQFEGSET